MRDLAFAAAVAALSAAASPASAYLAINGFSVTQTGPEDFVVNFRTTPNETAYWCAAGDFVTRELGLSGKTRIYRASPPPRKSGQGIAFTLDPEAAAASSGLSSFSAGGGDGSVSAGHASGSFCIFFDDLRFSGPRVD